MTGVVQQVRSADLPDLGSVASQGLYLPALGIIVVSGQVAWDAEGRLDADLTISAQFERAYRNVDLLLREVGVGRESIVKETVYIVGVGSGDPAALAGLLEGSRGGSSTPPVSTIVGVESLFAPEFLVEIEVMAYSAK